MSHADLDGALCPVVMTYRHDIQSDFSRETHEIIWRYEVRDEEIRSLNTIDLISLNGYQRSSEDASFGSYSSDATFSLKGAAHSPILGEGSLEITGSAQRNNGRAKIEATLNRERLTPGELHQIKMLLPRLGLAYE